MQDSYRRLIIINLNGYSSSNGPAKHQRKETGNPNSISMGQVSQVGPGTEAGKQLLKDFKDWRKTGFKPWGKGVGGAAHYETRRMYQVVSKNAFRSQAKKIAKIALEQMPAHDIQEDAEENNEDTEEEEDEKSLPNDSENKNPWQRELYADDGDEDEENDDDYSMKSEDEDCDASDDSLEDFFEEIKLGELQNSRAPFVSEYPGGNKLLLVFPLDGDVMDEDANQFEFFDGDKSVKRWSRVPKEREDAVSLVGNGSEVRTLFGFTDVDLMIVDAEIQRRLKASEHKRDRKGRIWEVRDTLTLPFCCVPTLYNKKGKKLNTFRMRSNGRGFSWAYFWLLAPEVPRARPSRRIGGKKVTVQEDSSVYTEETVNSDRGPLSEIHF
jgi:hypothetical protein